MAHLHSRIGKLWVQHRIHEPQHVLSYRTNGSQPGGVPVGLLSHCRESGRWFLVANRGARLVHNGQPVSAGLRLLEHGDALVLPGGPDPMFFSTDEAVSVEPLNGSVKVTCARCRGDIAPGQLAVKCSRCGVHHHEAADLGCWSYAATCAMCPQPTALSAHAPWTPASL